MPIRNGKYVLVRGEGYVDIPPIETAVETHRPALDFLLVTSQIGNSEMQHLDFAYANSIIRSFLADDSLVLTVRGRKYTPQFTFRVRNHFINVESVQTEVDAGYEGRKQVFLIEAKNSSVSNTIIRQLYYPYRQWKHHVVQSQIDKDVSVLFFEKAGKEYHLWQFGFDDDEDYNSIQLIRCARFRMS